MIKIKSFGSGSKGNIALIQNKETNILLDCGLAKEVIIKKLGNCGLLITDINAILVTHAHT